ncbi:hypothetical protein AB9E28_00250 [Rhizobium leguminosarum]|uniref:hypothetical protein n=1 Tax=Rhizobium leguminosarum TaxID=384 RepID=UPI003F9E2AD2
MSGNDFGRWKTRLVDEVGHAVSISRRAFLGFIATAPAASSFSFAAEAEQRDDGTFSLDFVPRDDGTLVEVIRWKRNQNGEQVSLRSLPVPLKRFGSAAWFDIEPSTDPKVRKLLVRDASYGNVNGRKLTLIFENNGGWRLTVVTDIWQDSGGRSTFLQRVPAALDDLIADLYPAQTGAADLAVDRRTAGMQGRSSLDGVKSTIDLMFGGRLDLARNIKNIDLVLTSDFQWRMSAEKPPLVAFSGMLPLSDFVIGWHVDANAENAPATEPFLFGTGAGILPDITIGSNEGVSAALSADEDASVRLEVYRVRSPFQPDVYQTVSRVPVSHAAATFQNLADVVVEKMPIGSVVLTETDVPNGTIRTVVAGNVEPVNSPGLSTAIGRLVIAAVEQKEQQSDADLGKTIASAMGSREGAPGKTFWLIADAQSPDTTSLIRRASVDVLLREADTALPDVSHSRLEFDDAEFRLAYTDGKELMGPFIETPEAEASSFLWLGAGPSDTGRASLDLSRASLTAARDYDHAHLRFRFADLKLAFLPTPFIVSGRNDCSFSELTTRKKSANKRNPGKEEPERQRLDTRPVLVVEFDPQHILEEAVLRPGLPPLPDVELTADQLGEVAKARDELERRTFVQARKLANEKATPSTLFADFTKSYEDAAKPLKLPPEQKMYIGPDGLDPDTFDLARLLQEQTLEGSIQEAIRILIDEVAKSQFDANLAAAGISAPKERETRLELERKLESSLPLYGLFRSFYRDEMLARPKRAETEYFHLSNRPDGNAIADEDAIRKEFSATVRGAEVVGDIYEGRLSGPTRLAFRLNCRPGKGDGNDANGLPVLGKSSPAFLGSGGTSFEGMPLTFHALTEWSHHEPAVTRRAQKVFSASRSGAVPPIGEQSADLNDHRMLSYQGLTEGTHVTGAQRMSEVRASLSVMPDDFETAIEIPSRVLLSTAQDAVWQTTRRVKTPVDDQLNVGGGELEDGTLPPQTPGFVSQISRDLWVARLLTRDVAPSVRVIGTPDMRPMALGAPEMNPLRALPGYAPPPRGPYPPWLLSSEQRDSTNTGPLSVYKDVVEKSEPDVTDGSLDDEKFCEIQKKGIKPNFPLIDWLCQRLGLRSKEENRLLFRSGLDAYDRHELVLLSSAYGLPVVGKRREMIPGDVNGASGTLIPGSGQFEPKEFLLLDGKPGEAIYRPTPLDVTELSLSALGGSFDHDTRFNPPAPALDLRDEPVFPGMSIERWQHSIVLGRDIRTEVVYKGYLFPFGHRASLVKLTERTFLKTKGKGYKAILRQRMFLRLGNPSKNYPAPGQPNVGRHWCPGSVEMLTRQTPDIVDPTMPSEPSNQSAYGKITLNGPGLAFWPKVDLTDGGHVKFEFTVDGQHTSMPFIFVDNVAATIPLNVEMLTTYYNDPSRVALRTLPMRGQKCRLAPEATSGDTAFSIQNIYVMAQGRSNLSTVVQWGGDNSLYATSPVLEGAEQPPFYPFIDCAEIRLEQVERFTGAELPITKVRFDGEYLDSGFAADKGRTRQIAGLNPLEVFLVLLDPVALDMGRNGDRSAGVARPNSTIVAISRLKGPLGADPKKLQYHDKLGQAVDGKTQIVSIAYYFADAAEREPATEAVGPAPLVPPSAEGRLKVFENFFSDGAKLLGLISLRDLMKLFDLSKAQLPLLREITQYGSAITSAQDEAIALVRANVLLPLKATVQSLSKQWNELDQRVLDEQKVEKFSLKTLFPEMEDGLASLERELDGALATTDAIALTQRLSRVFEAGKRFTRLLAGLASQAVDRVQVAARKYLYDQLGGIGEAVGGLALSLSNLRPIKDVSVDKIASILTEKLLDAITTVDEILPLPVQLDSLAAALGKVLETDQYKTARVVADKLQETFKKSVVAKATFPELQKDLEKLATLADPKPEYHAVAETISRHLVDAGMPWVNDAMNTVTGSNLTLRYRGALLRPLRALKRQLETLRDALANGTLAELEKGTVKDLARLRAQADLIKKFVEHVKSGDIEALLSLAATLTESLFGPSAADISKLSTFLSEPANLTAQAIDLLARTAGFERNGSTVWLTEAEARFLEDPASNNGVLPTASSVILEVAVAGLSSVDSLEKPVNDAKQIVTQYSNDIPSDTLRNTLDESLGRVDTLRNKLRGVVLTLYVNVGALGQALENIHSLLTDIAGAPLAEAPAAVVRRLEQNWVAIAVAVEGLLATFPVLRNSLYIQSPDLNLDAVKKELTDFAANAALKQAAPKITDALNELLQSATNLESQTVQGLYRALKAVLAVLAKGSVFSADVLEPVKVSLKSLPSILDPERQELLAAVGTLADMLVANGELAFKEDTSPNTIVQLLAKEVMPSSDKVSDFFGDAGPAEELREQTDNVQRALLQAAEALLGRVRAIPDKALANIAEAIRPALEPLASGYSELYDKRNAMLAKPLPGLDLGTLHNALRVPQQAPESACDPAADPKNCDRLYQEVTWLKAAATNLSDRLARDALQRFLNGWRSNDAAPLVIVRQLQDLLSHATLGQVLSMIDIAALRDEIEDALINLVPVRTRLAYDLDLSATASTVAASANSPFSLKDGTRFAVHTSAEINLLEPTAPKFEAAGSIGAFDINLLGSSFNALKLKFRGATFALGAGGKPSFDVDYDSFVIGKKLEFVKQLEAFLSPSGNGFYLQPLDGMPGIEAGYGINIGTIQLGGVSFSNVSLNVAALLPFSDSEAMFRASLARRLAPFTITSPPFGGAGYFSITANAQKIVGFEASFEFGGSADFSFGPLVAFGRVMSGFYIRTIALPKRTITELSGTFFAGGAASIWIFSCYASLYVKLGMTEGGTMEGEAIFSFSFSMGIVDYNYSVRVSNSQPALGNNSSSSSEANSGGAPAGGAEQPEVLELFPSKRKLNAWGDEIDTAITTGQIKEPPITEEDWSFVTGVTVSTVCQGKNSDAYFGYFDLTPLRDAL